MPRHAPASGWNLVLRPRNPFLPWLGGDLLSLPGIAERRVNWLCRLRDRLEKRIGQPWKPVGMRGAMD